MLCGALCCSRRFHVKGALAIDLGGEGEWGGGGGGGGGKRVGALAVSGSPDCLVDVEVAAAGLRAVGMVEEEAPQGGKIWRLPSTAATTTTTTTTTSNSV